MKVNGNFDYPYFRSSWNRVVVVLLTVSLAPLLIVGGVFYHFTAQSLKSKAINTLEIRLLERKAAIDSLLNYEAILLRQLTADLPLHGQSGFSSEQLRLALDSLNKYGLHCSRLVILQANGRVTASAGWETPELEIPAAAKAFNESVSNGVYASELTRGTDGKAYFFLGVGGNTERTWALFACIEISILDDMIPDMKEKHGKNLLVSRQVTFQSGVSANASLDNSLDEFPEKFGGIRLRESGKSLLLMTWQDRAPWMNALRVTTDVAYREVRRVRMIAIAVLLVIAIPVAGAILLVTNDLFSKLESKRGAIKTLDRQLRRTSYLSASMELSQGCFREVKDTIFNIDSTIAVLREEPVVTASTELTESLDQIQSEVRRARGAVERFLGYIQPQPPLISATDVHCLLNNLVDILERELRFRNIAIRRSFMEGLPAVRTDPSKLRQAFQNIVLNAIDAVNENGEISLTTGRCEKGVMVTVEDNGPGIPESQMAAVFEPLWTTRPQGTGLGLPICRDILTRLGGDISIESEPGKGTSVTIVIPLSFNPLRPATS